MTRRLQNRMATSRAALPIMMIYCVALWLAMLATEHTLLPQFLVFIINVFLMVELNNRNALMRQYSRMVSCSYIVLMMMCPWMLRDLHTMVLQTSVILSFYLLFPTYQKRSSMGAKYWAYLSLGIGSVVWPSLLYLLPLYWIAESAFLMSFSLRSFFASIFGILTPIWVITPFVVYENMYDSVAEHYLQLVPSQQIMAVFDDAMLLVPKTLPMDMLQIVSVSAIFVLFFTGLIHYMRNSYADKIHVRMLYHFVMLIAINVSIALVIVALLPFENRASVEMLLSIFVVCVSPLIAHYITFTNTRLTNISVVLIVIATIGYTIFQFLPMVPTDFSALLDIIPKF